MLDFDSTSPAWNSFILSSIIHSSIHPSIYPLSIHANHLVHTLIRTTSFSDRLVFPHLLGKLGGDSPLCFVKHSFQYPNFSGAKLCITNQCAHLISRPNFMPLPIPFATSAHGGTRWLISAFSLNSRLRSSSYKPLFCFETKLP